jgi:tetratricopeptide (TPR) repeat protein
MGLFSSLFSSSKTEERANGEEESLQNFDLLKYDGIRALQINKPKYAVKCFTEALKIQQDIETMKYRMTAYNALNMTDEAFETLDDMVATGEEAVDTLLLRANYLYLNERYPEAIADCEQIIAMEPDNFTAYFLLAKTEKNTGEFEKAIDHLDKTVSLKDDFVEAYILRADTYLTLEKSSEAFADVEKVIELSPEDETAFLLRGRIRELLGDKGVALLDYQSVLDLNPFNEAAYLLAGRLLLADNKYDDAITLFSEATEHIENFAAAFAARAVAKHRTGDQEGALADEETAKELNPEETGTPDENPNFDDLYKGNII